MDSVSDRNKALYTDEDWRENLCSIDALHLDSLSIATIKSQALSIACLIHESFLSKVESGHCLTKNPVLANIKTAVCRYHKTGRTIQPIGDKARFSHEPASGFGTAFYIGHQLALTAAHCLCEKGSNKLSAEKIRTTRLVFGFQMLDEKQHTSHFAEDDFYQIKTVVAHRYTRGKYWNDWALLKLDREVKGRIPLVINFTDKVIHKIGLYMLGHPLGLPLKFTRNGKVERQESEEYFDCTLDAFVGNSGSAVFSQMTHQLVGILFQGNEDFEWIKDRVSKKRVIKEYRVKEGDGYEKCQRTTSLLSVKDYIDALSKDPMAQTSLGICYLYGLFGLPVNKRKALKYLTDAISQHNSDATFVLADCYLSGEGIKKDLKIAEEYYKKAADLGFSIESPVIAGKWKRNADVFILSLKENYKHQYIIPRLNDVQFALKDTNHSVQLNTLFKNDISQLEKHIFIYEDSAYEKSVSQHIAYEWAHGSLWKEKFDALFIISARNFLHSDGEQSLCSILISSLEGQEIIYPPAIFHYVLNNKDRILFVLDGLNEFDQPQNKTVIEEILQFPYWIIASNRQDTQYMADTSLEKIKIAKQKVDSDFFSINLQAPLGYFVGRKDQMIQLEKALLPSFEWKVFHPVRWFATCGPAGQGKSELACSFANRHLEKFSFVHWVDSETTETLTQSYRDLAKAMKIYIDEKADAEEIRKLVFQALENHRFEKPWLLILDNVEKQTPFPQRGGFVLGTSRTVDVWPTIQNFLLLPPFTEPEAIALLKAMTGQQDEELMPALVRELEYFPLIINNASSYIVEQELTIQEYIDELHQDNGLIFYQKETERYPRSVKNAWALTFKQIENKSPLAFSWLRMCAHFNPVQIPIQWLQHWLQQEEQLAGIDLNQTMRSIKGILKNYGLIKYDKKTESFSLHRLTQKMIQDTQKNPEVLYQKSFALMLQLGNPFDEEKLDDWENVKPFLPQASWILSSPYLYQVHGSDLGKMWNILGVLKRTFADVSAAMQAHHQSLEEHRKIHGASDHPDIARSLNSLGYTFWASGSHQESLKYQEESLEMRYRLYGKIAHPEIANSLNGIGYALWELGRHEEELKFQLSALNMRREVYGLEPHPDVAQSLNSVGIAMSHLKRKEEELAYWNESLEMRQKIYRQKIHPDLAKSLHNVAKAIGNKGLHQEALEYCYQALDIYKKAYDTFMHPLIGHTLMHIGIFLGKLGSHEEALKYQLQANEVYQKVYKNLNHPHMVLSQTNLIKHLYKLDRKEEALICYQELLKTQQTLQGSSPNENIIKTLNDIGGVLIDLNLDEEAIQNYQKALEIGRNLYGTSAHSNLIQSLSQLGYIYKRNQSYEIALELSQEALEQCRKIHGLNPHEVTCFVLNRIGAVLVSLNRYEEAIPFFQNALQMGQTLYTSPHSRNGNHLYNLGLCFANLGRYEEAFSHFIRALEMRWQLYQSEAHKDVLQSLDDLENLLQKIKKSENMTSYHQKTLRVYRMIYPNDNHPRIQKILPKAKDG